MGHLFSPIVCDHDPEYLLHDPRDKSTTACNPFSACFMRTRGRKPGLDLHLFVSNAFRKLGLFRQKASEKEKKKQKRGTHENTLGREKILLLQPLRLSAPAMLLYKRPVGFA